MRRIYLFIVVVFGMATVALAQTTSSDSQTLQALLGEVHQLRQDSSDAYFKLLWIPREWAASFRRNAFSDPRSASCSACRPLLR